MQPVGYSGVDNRKGAFKMAIKKANGRWYMYVSHLWHDGWSILDVTDPRDPKFVKFIPGSDNTWNIQVTLHDNLMLTALQKSVAAWGADPSEAAGRGRAASGTSATRSIPSSSRTGRLARAAPTAIPIRAAATLICRPPRRATPARSS